MHGGGEGERRVGVSLEEAEFLKDTSLKLQKMKNRSQLVIIMFKVIVV